MRPYQRLTNDGKKFFQPQMTRRSFYQEGEVEEDYSDVFEEKYHGPTRNVPQRASSIQRHVQTPQVTTKHQTNQTQNQGQRRTTGPTTYRDTAPVRRTPAYTYTEKRPVKRKRQQDQSWFGKFLTISLLLIVIGFSLHVVAGWAGDFFTGLQYGNPRTMQADYIVGHNNDSILNPSHFIAINLHGQIEVIEIPGGDASKSTVYVGPNIVNEKVPVRVTFTDVNNDNKPDMVLHIDDGTNHVMIMMNTGTKFDPKVPVPLDAAKKVK